MIGMIWGSTIIFLVLVHMWCDACFGVRFSNLTHRGVITNGPYRFMKHPAYVIKNIRWWMVSVPFAVGGSFEDNLRLSLILVCVNIVYSLRGFAEEKLLSQDPAYIEYGLWMDKNGWFKWLSDLIPQLKYETRLKKWLERGELKVKPAEFFR
jgi:protein-S-isoprenylcysteine O-methyltransferase Ste14